jgi:hypothetical protein
LARVIAAKSSLEAAGVAFAEAAFPIPRLVTGENRTGNGRTIHRISDLATLVRPRRIDPEVIGTGTTPLIRPKDIGPDLVVTPSEKVDLEMMAGQVELTERGDILVLADGARPRAGVVRMGGAAVSAPLLILRPHVDSIDSIVLAALISSLAPKYAVGTTVKHVDLPTMEIPYPPDPRTTSWLRKALEALGEQQRQALATVQAIDELRADLVEGLSTQALKLPSKALDAEGQ